MIDERITQPEASSVVAPPGEVSVIVPAMNEEQSIVRLLEALAAQTLCPAEIVVADGGSIDRTRELVRDFQKRAPFPVVLVETRCGLPGRNRNLAIARATGEWIACVDAGCAPRADWLEQLVAAARRAPHARVVFGQYEALATSFFTRCAAVAYVPAPGEPVRSTASCMLHRSAWELAGPFREDLRSAEDLLFFRALDAARVPATHAPDAFVTWELQPDASSTFRKFTVYARNNMRAGLAREWQRGVARFYAVVLASLVAGLFFRPLLLAPVLLLLLRGARRVWAWHARDEPARRAAALFNPTRLLVVTWINFVIDAATFYGTFQWFAHDHVGVPEGEKGVGGRGLGLKAIHLVATRRGGFNRPPALDPQPPLLMSISTLYLCYFGLREPLVQTQVLPYLRQLAAGGVEVSLLTFEPELGQRWTHAELADERSKLAREGIRWHMLPYHKSPSLPATAFDILAGARVASRLVRREGIKVLHARSHVPMAMALLARTRARCRTIFDVRGLLAEEYEDAGVWRAGSLPFRAVKKLELAGLRRADAVVVLTRRMRDWLASQNLADAEKIEVIPCCVDFARYDGAESEEKSERFEVVYAGSVTGLYMLEEMARFFLAVRELRPGALLRVLTTSPADAAAGVLRRAGLSEEDFHVSGVRSGDVPRLLRRAQLGVSFRRATFSQIAASPTKVPEYLAAGLPVVGNAGVGDTDELLEQERVGVLVREFDAGAYARAAQEALRLCEEPDAAARCVEVARKYFDLEAVGGRRYLGVYRRLEEGAVARAAANV